MPNAEEYAGLPGEAFGPPSTPGHKSELAYQIARVEWLQHTLQRRNAEVAALRAALTPFVSMRWDWGENAASEIAVLADEGPMLHVTVGDWRHARRILFGQTTGKQSSPAET
jgi:hypothetical protein